MRWLGLNVLGLMGSATEDEGTLCFLINHVY